MRELYFLLLLNNPFKQRIATVLLAVSCQTKQMCTAFHSCYL